MTLQDTAYRPAYRPAYVRPSVVLDDFMNRIRDAAEEARDLDDLRVDAHRRRNALIVEAVDAGLTARAAARAAGLAQTRITFLLARSQGERED